MHSASDFSKYNPNSCRHAEYFLQKYRDSFSWNDSEDILEVGCANGLITREVLYPFLRQHLNSLLAVDVSESAIDIANVVNKNPKIAFRVMDFGDEKNGNIYEEKFHKIFSFYCLQLVQPAEAWPRNSYKMLKKGGQVFGTIILCPNLLTNVLDEQVADTQAPWNEYIKNRPYGITALGPKPVEVVSKMLTDAGFVIDVIALEKGPHTYEIVDNFIKTMLSLNFMMKYVPDDLKKGYNKDYLRRTQQQITIDENGHLCYILDILCFIATKT